MEDAQKLHEYAQHLVRQQASSTATRAAFYNSAAALPSMPYHARMDSEHEAEKYKRDHAAWQWVEGLVQAAIAKGA